MRWRFGVDGAFPSLSLLESRPSSSFIDLRRFFALHGDSGPNADCLALGGLDGLASGCITTGFSGVA